MRVFLEFGVAVVLNEIKRASGTEALAVMVDDGWAAFGTATIPRVMNGYRFSAQVARSFVTCGLEGESVVDANFASGFEVEELVVKLGIRKKAKAADIEFEAVDGLHPKGGVVAGVIGVFDPTIEEIVEFFQGADVVEISGEELVADGAEEAFDFALCCSVAHGSMDEDGAESGADLGELFGRIVRAVVGVNSFGDAAFEEGVLETTDEVEGVVFVIEAGIGDDAGGVVDEGDKIDLAGRMLGGIGFAAEAKIGTVKGVNLPEVVGVSFGKSEATFGGAFGFRFEEVELFDGSSKGIGGNEVVAEMTFFKASSIDGLNGEAALFVRRL